MKIHQTPKFFAACIVALLIFLAPTPSTAEAETIILFNTSEIERQLRNILSRGINEGNLMVRFSYPPHPAPLLDLCTYPARIGLQLAFTLKGKKLGVPFSGRGNAAISFSLRLDSQHKGLFIEHLKVDQLNLINVPRQVDDLVRSVLTKSLGKQAAMKPVLSFSKVIQELSPKVALKTDCSGVGVAIQQ